MAKFKVSRRDVLRGAAGAVAIGLCPLEAMFNNHGTAYAQSANIPKRFLLYFFPNGVDPATWVPATQGLNPTLPTSLAPLIPHQKHVRVVSGLNTLNGEQNHFKGLTTVTMGEVIVGSTGSPKKITADQMLIPTLGNPSLPSRQYGLFKENGKSDSHQAISYDASGNVMKPILEPSEAFSNLFGGTYVPPGGEATPEQLRALRRKASVLDAVEGDIARLQPKLGVADRARLDAHLTSVRELEQSIFGPAPASPGTSLSCGAPLDGPGVTYQDKSRQMNQLMTLALACDRTRVLSYMVAGGQSSPDLSFLANPDANGFVWHQASHAPKWSSIITSMAAWTMGELADLVQRISTAEEGSGLLMDNTFILVCNEVGQAVDHGSTDLPLLLISGHSSVQGNYHWRGAGQPGGALTLSLLQAMGMPITQLGTVSSGIPLAT